MHRADVVVFQVHFEEHLPIEIVLLFVDALEHVIRRGELGPTRERRQFVMNVARPGEQQPVPLGELGPLQVEARILVEMRRRQLAGR